MPVFFERPQAQADVDEIWLFIAQDDLARADSFVGLITERYRLLAENPLMGRDRSQLAVGLRSFPVGNYIIFYMPLPNGIEVVRVLSGARDFDALFDPNPGS
jgi:toxin ParE1/3/4